jgi:hypothetical protein
MAYHGLREKLFTKNGTKLDFTWLSTQFDHGLCKFHSKLLNPGAIFGKDVYLSKANNFCN